MADTTKQNVQPASLKEAGLFSAMQDRLNAPFTGPLLSDLITVEDGVEDGQDCLTSKDIQDMESILQRLWQCTMQLTSPDVRSLR